MKFHKLMATTAGAAAALALSAGIAAAATLTFDFKSADKNGNTYVAAGGGGLVFENADVRLTVTAFNYVEDPFSLGAEIGVGLVTGAQGGLGACSAGEPAGCTANPNLDSHTNPELAEMLVFTFSAISTGNLLTSTVINLIDFNINNEFESFDAFTGTPWVSQISNEQVGVTAGAPNVSGNVTVNLGPSAMFGVGVDSCASGADTVSCSVSNTDQVRVGYITTTVPDECISRFGCDGEVNVVPVPATLPLLAGGLAVAGFVMRRKSRKA